MTLNKLYNVSKDALLKKEDNRFVHVCPVCTTNVTLGKWLNGVTDYTCISYYRCKCGQICCCVN